jgi:hypothetical protein
MNLPPPVELQPRVHHAGSQACVQRLRSGYHACLIAREVAQFGRDLASHVPIIGLETDNSAAAFMIVKENPLIRRFSYLQRKNFREHFWC